MQKKLMFLLFVGLFLVPSITLAGQEEKRTSNYMVTPQQKQSMQIFRNKFKIMTPKEREVALAARRQENKALLESKLSGNPKLTPAQKTELISFFESQYQDNISFNNLKRKADLAFFEQTANNQNLTQAQKKAAIKSYRDEQKKKIKAQIEAKKAKIKANAPAVAK